MSQKKLLLLSLILPSIIKGFLSKWWWKHWGVLLLAGQQGGGGCTIKNFNSPKSLMHLAIRMVQIAVKSLDTPTSQFVLKQTPSYIWTLFPDWSFYLSRVPVSHVYIDYWQSFIHGCILIPFLIIDSTWVSYGAIAHLSPTSATWHFYIKFGTPTPLRHPWSLLLWFLEDA